MRFSFTLLLIPALTLAASLTQVLSRSAPVQSETLLLRNLTPQAQYSLLFSLSTLRLAPGARVELEVRQGADLVASKTLHVGDADYYTQFRVPRAGNASLTVKAQNVAGKYSVQVNRWPLSPTVKSVPNHRWQDAQPIPLGKTVFASGDDAEYIPLPGGNRKALAEEPAGLDWYKLEFTSAQPKLVYFQVDLMERDQIPVNVTVHRLVNGKLEEFFEGEDPVTVPHEVQALPGNKFTTRTLKDRGTYYIAVRANHPEYKLRTRVYDPPPYTDAHIAIRTALDFIIGAGDSWHANTPRRGGILDRVSSVHQETSLCVGCHVTHFPLRAQMYATRNGYPVVQRQQVQWLTERFYNNPRPFYGFEQQGAVWARVISAPANVLGRMSHLLDIYEDQVTGERRESYHEAIVKYLNLYYSGRDKLPPDETNGNTPLVSAHEVAWYAWTATKDPRMGDFIAKGEVKNMIDLCYQTLALAEIDRARYSEQIAKNAERILSLQRPDGQWSARFEPNQPAVEFQTGHALWTLQAAGIPATNPQVAKAIDFLLKRQQAFGGWLDPLQSFENFRTPFRETQMAILALSAYFPAQRAKGWNTARLDRLSADPVEMLDQLDQVWDAPTPEVRKQIEAATQSTDALIRQAAVEALGRLGYESKLLGDPSKLVQRTAAWATRQAYSRHQDTPSSDLTSALASADDRTRWGATRVFAAHFAALGKRPEVAASLEKLISDPAPLIRMQAVKGLWQFWFWAPDEPTKGKIEDTILAAIGEPQPAWVESNLQEAVYNLADENIRYLYNNWVPLLGQQEDRDRVIRGRLGIEARLAAKFAAVLDQGPDRRRKDLLRSLTELPLRRGDIYDLEADLGKTAPPVYNRIGNDIEQIAFFGPSADRLAQSLTPLLDSSDPELRRLAAQASLLVRDSRFGEVNKIAGPMGPAVKTLNAKVEKTAEAAEVMAIIRPPARQPNAPGARPAGPRATRRLDEAFFRGYVEPILTKRGRDGYACVHCHATHTLFNGTFSTALNVVDTADPENSLILKKPTSSSETEGIAGTLAHGGGIRFPKDSAEYAIILDWIKGAKE